MKHVTLHEITIAEVCYGKLWMASTLVMIVHASGKKRRGCCNCFEHDILSSTAPTATPPICWR